MIQATGKIATTLIDGLKQQPLALPVVVVNALCLGLVAYTLYTIAQRVEERDRLLAEMVQKCK